MNKGEFLKKPNRRIGFDIDGVWADINSQAVNKLNETFARNYQHDSVSSWDWVYDEAYRLSTENNAINGDAVNIAKAHRAVYFDSAALRMCKPYPGTVLVLRWLEQLGVPYDFVTTRKPENALATHGWFGEHLPWVEKERVHIRDNVLSDPDEFKLNKAKEIQAGLFFEDKQETAALLRGNGVRVALVNRSWNKDFSELDSVRVHHGSIGIFSRALVFAAIGR